MHKILSRKSYKSYFVNISKEELCISEWKMLLLSYGNDEIS